MLFWMGFACMVAAILIWIVADEIALGWLALSASAGLYTGDALITGQPEWVALAMGCLSVLYLGASAKRYAEDRKRNKEESNDVGSDTHEGQDDGQLSQGAGDHA